MMTVQINIEKAIMAYHTMPELNNEDIRSIFDGKISQRKILKLKDAARMMQKSTEQFAFGSYAVNTDCLFQAMNIDIAELEKKYGKLKKLGLI